MKRINMRWYLTTLECFFMCALAIMDGAVWLNEVKFVFTTRNS